MSLVSLPRLRGRARDAGFALPTAIFLVVVLAALAAFMVRVSITASSSQALDFQATRAYQAARAGIEWAAYLTLDPDNSGVDPDPCPASPSSVTLDGVLAQFTVSVTCARTLETDGATSVAIYQIMSTASTGTTGTNGYVERVISTVLAK
jgi:MSHA biogenesis protein MshP